MGYRILTGDCIDQMHLHLDENVVQTCITSPPYFGLRDYGVDGQIGLEETPEQYVAKLVEVFREVRRVLKDDGTLWLNLGDSYATPPGGSGHQGKGGQRASRRHTAVMAAAKGLGGLKPKDLIGIPWRVAFALQADGWYLRQDIIWHKPNPMPESVRDRCTKAHEYIFLFAKSERYYFDAEAIAEPLAESSIKRLGQATLDQQAGSDRVPSKTNGNMKVGGNGETRNRRSVWTITTKPFKDAHFATFPIDLIEPCVLAGSRSGDLILDPFGGAGTTALAALMHDRDAVLCELNPDYVAIAEDRLRSVQWQDRFIEFG